MDYDSSVQLSKEVVAAGSDAADLPLVLDMSRVEFVPSVALGALMTLTRLFKEANQRFVIVGVQASLRETLSICNLDKLFEMYDTPKDAVGHLSSS